MCRSQGRPIHRPGALFGEVPCHARFVQPMGRLLLPPALLTHCLRGEETGIRKTMKNYLLAWLDNIPLRKRFIIETLFDALNSSQGLEHSRHRSPTNAFVHIFSRIVAIASEQPNPNSAQQSECRLSPNSGWVRRGFRLSPG
jgi:hypothetical protein